MVGLIAENAFLIRNRDKTKKSRISETLLAEMDPYGTAKPYGFKRGICTLKLK